MISVKLLGVTFEEKKTQDKAVRQLPSFKNNKRIHFLSSSIQLLLEYSYSNAVVFLELLVLSFCQALSCDDSSSLRAIVCLTCIQ